MTELIRSQLHVFLVMCLCGMGLALVWDVVQLFVRVRRSCVAKIVAYLVYFVFAGFFVSEAMYFCHNGKITFLGIGSLLFGLWLWKKFFCDILTPIGGKDVEKKG